jgi:hypothetical protein
MLSLSGSKSLNSITMATGITTHVYIYKSEYVCVCLSVYVYVQD